MRFKRIEVYPFLSSMYLKLHILPLDFLIKAVAQVLRLHLRQSREKLPETLAQKRDGYHEKQKKGLKLKFTQF